jgi:glucosamine-6-phosphate deaminase
MTNFPIEQKNINVFPTRQEMGNAAGKDIETKIVDLLQSQVEVRMIFAAAPSQNEVLTYLVSSKKINWNRIIAFHMDEYLGLNENAPQLFSKYLDNILFTKQNFKQIHRINSQNDPVSEINRYSALIKKAPIDIICLGIGENGHIAFNDPPTADFKDKLILKQVLLDKACREQQVNDGCFEKLDDVPNYALTLTIPVLMSGRHLYCVVPGETKKQAVTNTIQKPISTLYPSTILRKHPECRFYFDRDSYRI